MFGETGELIGQILSIIAVVTGFVALQMKSPRGILFFLLVTSLLFTFHYLLIGATDAVLVNLVATIMCVVYSIRDRRGSRGMTVPIIFAVLIVLSSLLSWEGWQSVFLMAGLAINAISISLPNPQTTRKLNFIKSPLCLTYNVLVFSVGGIIFEASILASSVIGLIRHRNKSDSSGKKTTE